MTASLVPGEFAAQMRHREPEAGVSGADWIDDLPRLIDECLQQWALAVDGDPICGHNALVLPVRREAEPAVLKITWPHPEAAHEHLALRAWRGRDAVRLLAADPSRWALLLERLDAARTLQSEPIDTACQTVGSLLRALDVPALPQLDRLSSYAARLAEALVVGVPTLPPRFVSQARNLLRDLTSSSEIDDRLVHTDLHYANVLHGRNGRWLAIDPHPMAADPAFAVAPMLWNRWPEAVDGGVRRSLRRRLDIICETSGIDEDRARAWTIVREVDNARYGGTGPDGEDRVTLAVAIIKAMQE